MHMSLEQEANWRRVRQTTPHTTYLTEPRRLYLPVLLVARQLAHNIPVSVVSGYHKSPSATIGQRTKVIDKTEVPAPNNYDVNAGMGTR